MLDDARQRGFRPRTLGGDRGYDTRQCVKDMRDRGVTPTRSSANSLGDRRENNPAFELRAEPEDSQVGGGDIRVDEDDGGDSDALGIEAWSVLAWPGTLWLRPTTWCGWRTCCLARRSGPFKPCDLSGAQCTQNGLTEPPSHRGSPPESSRQHPKIAFSLTKTPSPPTQPTTSTTKTHSSTAC